jgi:hypothetical protein
VATERRARPGACAALFAFALGCSVAVENPPAFEAERFLCLAEHADEWQAEVDRCREAFERDASCGGVISFSGRIEGKDVAVDTRITGNEFIDWQKADGVQVRQQIMLYGRSPYFYFSFQWRELGGDLIGGADGRELGVGTSTQPDEVLDDDLVRPSLRMTVGAESRAFAFRDGSLSIERQALEEESATFDAELADEGDSLSGCFLAFALTRRISRESTPDAAE